MSAVEQPHGTQDGDQDSGTAAGRPRHSAGRGRSIKATIVLLLVFDLIVGLVAKEANIQHAELEALKRASTELAEAGTNSLLVLGGTAARADILPAEVGRSLDIDEGPWTAVSTPIGASTIAVWSAAYDEHFVRADQRPNLIVLGFVNDELEDQNQIDWAAIGNLHTRWGSLGARWDSAPDLNAKADVVGSWASSTIGNRSWLFDVVSAAIPGHSAVPRQTAGSAEQAETFAILSDLVTAIRSQDGQVAVVALPTQRSYPLPDELVPTVTAAGGVFIDLRLEGELSEREFVSSASLTPEAAADLSARLAIELNNALG